MISNDLKPSSHCANTAKGANQALGQIARAFHYRNKKVLAKLFKVHIRNKLEYAAQAWSPWLEKKYCFAGGSAKEGGENDDRR